jgi:hypothetical protein
MVSPIGVPFLLQRIIIVFPPGLMDRLLNLLKRRWMGTLVFVGP